MFRKKTDTKDFDRENLVPVLKCSVCTGEQVAGFRNKHTGRFTDIMFIRNQADLDEFRRIYNITDIKTEY